jgi:hypothetical protein
VLAANENVSIRNYQEDFFIRQGDRQKDDAVLPPRARNGNQFGAS